jgi:hypothetical protein
MLITPADIALPKGLFRRCCDSSDFEVSGIDIVRDCFSRSIAASASASCSDLAVAAEFSWPDLSSSSLESSVDPTLGGGGIAWEEVSESLLGGEFNREGDAG